MDKEEINREEKLFEEAKKFVEDHIDAFKELADGPDIIEEKSEEAYKNFDKVADEIMEKYDKAFKELAK
ncbi:hypothetical protein [Peptoniphilus grossensis]|uniref:Uncharacterized protein n=1 Tax=Peptoniphilus grossensis TaxID=1465756 RepID=A0ABU7XAB9_9FIRM